MMSTFPAPGLISPSVLQTLIYNLALTCTAHFGFLLCHAAYVRSVRQRIVTEPDDK